jgi:dCTP diphosphatase
MVRCNKNCVYMIQRIVNNMYTREIFMNDQTTTVALLKKCFDDFVREREWHQFHSPKNLSINIATEAAELMEHFLWCDTHSALDVLENNRQEIEDELADVLMAVCSFANASSIDLAGAFERKLAKAKLKYPVEKCKGRSDKYTVYL